jgi:hypothetical protein
LNVRSRALIRCLAAGAAALASGVPAALVSADEPNAPIAVAVTSSLEGEKGLGRIFSAAGRGDAAATANDVERLLARMRWARLVSRDPEVVVTIDSRERYERGRRTDNKGKVSIDHRYRADGSVEVGRRRMTVRAEHDFTEGEYSTRNDGDQFQKVAEKLVTEITSVVMGYLDDLRPNRPVAGFEHQAKYKLLFKGDGLEVKSVEPGSPAEAAGLQVKDRIRRLDDEKGTDQMDARVRTWWTEAPGTRVSLEYERNKQRQTVQLMLLPREEWARAPAAPAPAAAAVKTPAAQRDPGRRTGGQGSVELKPGMTELEVVRLLGEPREKVAFGAKRLWRYEGYSVTFQNGRVTDVN